MAELKPFEVIMRLSPYAPVNSKNEVCFHAEKVSELVRCKDCKHLNKEEMRCFEVEGLGYRNVVDEDFCSRGARKEEVEE